MFGHAKLAKELNGSTCRGPSSSGADPDAPSVSLATELSQGRLRILQREQSDQPARHSSGWRPPKGMDSGTVDHFSCKTASFWGCRVGATMVIMDPGQLELRRAA